MTEHAYQGCVISEDPEYLLNIPGIDGPAAEGYDPYYRTEGAKLPAAGTDLATYMGAGDGAGMDQEVA